MLKVQPSLPTLCPIANAQAFMAESSDADRAAIYTKPEVVNFILDLVGYQSSRPLQKMRLLEPSMGQGEFVLAAVDRLLKSANSTGTPLTEASLGPCIRAVELHPQSLGAARTAMVQKLTSGGVDREQADGLCDQWLIQGDFLLTDFSAPFDVVAGNPPYLRQEAVPDALMTAYRQRFETIYDRADLYVPFYEHGLAQLGPGGKLGFICANRWMKNRYGAKLRGLVARDYHLETYVDMIGTQAFQSDVISYPAITVISRQKSQITQLAYQPEIETEKLLALSKRLTGKAGSSEANSSTRTAVGEGVVRGEAPWILDNPDHLALVRRLEATFPNIEDAGCTVGIGVATGADKAFIGDFASLDVEDDRKLPLVTTRDIASGTLQWRGQGVINPFGPDGKLVSLADYPKLARYLREREDVIARRHVAKKSPARWYRTIDKIHPALTHTPKLLIPDIKGDAHIVSDPGSYYPHHNLYFIATQDWDLEALRVVLRSGVARLFVALYSTRMRGGYLRFQAQYLRRIRLPEWCAITPKLREQLVAAGADDRIDSRPLVQELYGLTAAEAELVFGAKEADRAA